MVDEERDIHWLAPDPRAPLTLDKRAQLSVDEVKELARRQGVAIPG